MRNSIILDAQFKRTQLMTFIKGLDLNAKPLEFRWRQYKRDRSVEQNALIHKLYALVSEQREDLTPTEVRSISKLHWGVPLMRALDPEYNEAYQTVVMPHPYELKLKLMAPPIDFPVTSLMTVGMLSKYYEQIKMEWAKQGVFFREDEG